MLKKPFTDEEFVALLQIKTENKNLDFKEMINWGDDTKKDDKLGIIKDILAMSNTRDGGKIIFGVKDIGLEPIGLSEEDYNSIDTTKVNDLLHTYSEPKFSCFVYKYDIDKEISGKFVLIDIPEFTETPIICKKDAHSNGEQNKQILKDGAIYIRTDKAGTEIVPSYYEMKELLSRAIRKNGDDLLKNIKNLIDGKPTNDNGLEVEIYNKEMKEADNFFSENIDNNLKNFGYWKLFARPVKYNKDIFNNQAEIKDRIQNSEVNLRGWNFPHTDETNKSNFNNGFQSFTIWDRYVEAYKAFQDGLFIWKRAIWEDVESITDNGKRTLSFISAIWSITEYLIFLSRYYEDKEIEEIDLKIEMFGIKDRKLTSTNSGVFLHAFYVAKDNLFTCEKIINTTELSINSKEIAREIIKKLFSMFNWDNPADIVVESWQNKLIDRKF